MPAPYARLLITGILSILLASPARGAVQGASVIDDGYAGKVLQKILETAKINLSQRTDLRLSLDDQGHIVDCKAVKGKDSKAVCAAAASAAPFGTPPYGVPVSILLALWPGQNGQTATRQAESATIAAGTNAKYLDQIRRQIRNSIYIPEKTKPGTYHATARIKLDKGGKILESSLLKGSGDKLLDKYVLQGITRAAAVAPPPDGKTGTVDLTFTLIRH